MLALAADVRDGKSQQKAVDQVVAKWGGIDVLLANAGIGYFGSIETLTEADWNDPGNSPFLRAGALLAIAIAIIAAVVDFLIAFAMPERRFKTELIDAAAIDSGHRVLDVACGTGKSFLPLFLGLFGISISTAGVSHAELMIFGGLIEGVRIDHVDGLRDPLGRCRAPAARAAASSSPTCCSSSF